MGQAVREPAWKAKQEAGKLFLRVACARCGTRFHFSAPPRATRFPRCPGCGSLQTLAGAA
jgi:hypothetical protein